MTYVTNAQAMMSQNIFIFEVCCCLYLLVEICWSSQSASAVADAGLTAADWYAVVLGFLKPASVPPVRVVVNAAAVKLTEEQSRTMSESPQSLEFRLLFEMYL